MVKSKTVSNHNILSNLELSTVTQYYRIYRLQSQVWEIKNTSAEKLLAENLNCTPIVRSISNLTNRDMPLFLCSRFLTFLKDTAHFVSTFVSLPVPGRRNEQFQVSSNLSPNFADLVSVFTFRSTNYLPARPIAVDSVLDNTLSTMSQVRMQYRCRCIRQLLSDLNQDHTIHGRRI